MFGEELYFDQAECEVSVRYIGNNFWLIREKIIYRSEENVVMIEHFCPKEGVAVNIQTVKFWSSG